MGEVKLVGEQGCGYFVKGGCFGRTSILELIDEA
jgi:hypothetical protein